MKKARRFAAAKILHAGCNALDSLRILTWGEALGYNKSTPPFGLTDKEYRLLDQRYKKVRDCVADVREIARHLERTAKR